MRLEGARTYSDSGRGTQCPHAYSATLFAEEIHQNIMSGLSVTVALLLNGVRGVVGTAAMDRPENTVAARETAL